jgi:hypothetical protein
VRRDRTTSALFVSASGQVVALTNLTVTASVAHTSSTGVAQGGGLYASGASPGKVLLTNATVGTGRV